VLKIETLKSLRRVTPEEQDLFHGINLKKRIDNIEERLKYIQQNLYTIAVMRGSLGVVPGAFPQTRSPLPWGPLPQTPRVRSVLSICQ
jgi:hypothetical protein